MRMHWGDDMASISLVGSGVHVMSVAAMMVRTLGSRAECILSLTRGGM